MAGFPLQSHRVPWPGAVLGVLDMLRVEIFQVLMTVTLAEVMVAMPVDCAQTCQSGEPSSVAIDFRQ